MATDDPRRSVSLSRTGPGMFLATNLRGGTVAFGNDGDSFTPVELLLVAIGGCSGMDVDAITAKRAQPERFDIAVTANKVRDEHGNHLQDFHVTFRVAFPDGPEGDAARDVLPAAVQKSHDRLCTVSRTVELSSPIAVHIAD